MLRVLILTFVGGVAWLQHQPTLPRFAALVWLFAAAVALLAAVYARRSRLALIPALLAAALAGFYYAAWRAELRVAEWLPASMEGRDLRIVGVVAELPQPTERGLRFVFDVERVETPAATVPRRIKLLWFTRGRATELEEGAHLDPGRPRAGERWQLVVRLKRPHGTYNFHGFDYEAWLLERGIGATGYVRRDPEVFRIDGFVARPGYAVERLREILVRRMGRVLGDAPYGGVLVALVVGEQRAIPEAQWTVFTRTGVNHLMSISGLHVTMFAAAAAALVHAFWRVRPRLARRWPARQAGAVAAVVAAGAYATLTGFAVPAQRTFYMLAGGALAMLSRRTVSASRILAVALAAVVLVDPWAVLSPGFWLSFGAVALLFYVSVGEVERLHWLVEAARAQWAVTLGLVPLLLVLFQQFSLVSPLANAVAIPVVSLVVVPLALLGAVLPVDFLLHLAHAVMAACAAYLAWLSGWPAATWQSHAPPLWTVILALVGVAWLLAPRGFPGRYLGATLFLPMALVVPAPPPAGTVEAVVLDVGQGLAVVVRTARHVLLYDAGPRYSSEADAGGRVVLPHLRGEGVRRLDGLIVSHQDNDHAGGAASVLSALPVGWVLSSLPQDDPLLAAGAEARRCLAGQRWVWDGVVFTVLHPRAEDYGRYRKSNDLGCVLRVDTPTGSLLLTADIEARVERDLLARAAPLSAQVLVVPHHGSRTSSSELFAAAVSPREAVFTVGYRNRFGHPKQEVVERYRAVGSRLWRSDRDGALRILPGEPLRIETARATRPRYWHTRPERD